MINNSKPQKTNEKHVCRSNTVILITDTFRAPWSDRSPIFASVTTFFLMHTLSYPLLCAQCIWKREHRPWSDSHCQPQGSSVSELCGTKPNLESSWKNRLVKQKLKEVVVTGSWLGPLSFLVLINDLKPDCLVHKYVDDTTLTDRTKPSSMQSFHRLLNGADQNDMVVNLTKTKEMVFGLPAITSNLPTISASSYQIQRASEAKLLGIHIDSNLSWHTHVEAIVSKPTSDCIFWNSLSVRGFPAPICFTSIFQSSILSWNMQSLFAITSTPKLRSIT